jgi:VWFA-related protein
VKRKLFFSSAVALTLFAQTPAPAQPVSRADARLVEIDVVVRDRNGPVTDLTQSDFTLFDKGKEQKIASFLLSNLHAPPKPALAPNVFVNRADLAGKSGGTTVILLDALDTPPQLQAYMRDQSLRALSEIKPEEHVAVYVLGTSLHVLNDANNRYDAESGELERWLAESSVANGLAVETRLHNTVGALVTIAENIGRLPGRKNLVWVAGLFPVEVDHYGAGGPPGWQNTAVQETNGGGINHATGDPTQVDRQVFQHAFQPAMQALNLANIAVYAADARGLVGSPNTPTATSNSRSRGSSTASNTVPTTTPGINPVQMLAEDSGGRAFESTNDIQRAIRSAIDDAEVSYTLGYYPDSKMLDSRFHDLKVQVNRKDVEVHSRKGYVAIPLPKISDAQRTEAIKQALLSSLEASGIGLMAAFEKVDQPKPGCIRATLIVSGRDLVLQQNSGQWTGEFEFILTPRSADGKDRGTIRQAVALKLNQAQYDTVMQQGLSVTKTLEPTGDVAELRAVVCDHVAGRVGSLIMPVK